MKRFLLLPVTLLSLTLAGCGPGSKVGDLIAAATTTIVNPVDARDIYAMKNGFAAALQLKKDWRAYCWSKSYEALMKDQTAKVVCENRRPRWRTILVAQAKADSAVVSATVFVRDNPTLNARAALTAGWAAITDFQSAVPVAR